MKTENYILNSSEFIPHWFEDVQKRVTLLFKQGEIPQSFKWVNSFELKVV